MPLRVRVSRRAAAQIDKAAQWWAENRPDAPGAVRADIGEVLLLLSHQPGIGTAAEAARKPGIRRLFVGRIRYFVYYTSMADTLDVLAVWHVSRGRQPRL